MLPDMSNILVKGVTWFDVCDILGMVVVFRKQECATV